jgi:transcriptional regulator NrdR family protein
MIGTVKRRRRKCCNCGKLFTGYEMYDDEYVKLIKENKAIQKIKKALEEA